MVFWSLEKKSWNAHGNLDVEIVEKMVKKLKKRLIRAF
jgi:hypothetical protein